MPSPNGQYSCGRGKYFDIMAIIGHHLIDSLALQFTSLITAMHGFVAKDDKRNEFVVSFRGTKETSTILIGVE